MDPTHTKTLRKEYSAAAYKRFRKLKGDIRRAVVDLDVLGLGIDTEALSLEELVGLAYRTDNAEMPSTAKFKFATDAQKANAFNGWLGRAIQQDILEKPGGERWTDDFVRRSNASGMKQANRFLRQTPGYEVPPMSDREFGNMFNMPIHKNTLERLYTRNWTALNKITNEMSGEMSRVLTEGLAKGLNPRKMAKQLNDRVDKIGITRARTMARTEVIYAHNEAMLDSYKRAGLQKVSAKVEWLTARDGNVCSLCLGQVGGNPYKLEAARGLIPFHPNCRCTWMPMKHPQAQQGVPTTSTGEPLPPAQRPIFDEGGHFDRAAYQATKETIDDPEDLLDLKQSTAHDLVDKRLNRARRDIDSIDDLGFDETDWPGDGQILYSEWDDGDMSALIRPEIRDQIEPKLRDFENLDDFRDQVQFADDYARWMDEDVDLGDYTARVREGFFDAQRAINHKVNARQADVWDDVLPDGDNLDDIFNVARGKRVGSAKMGRALDDGEDWLQSYVKDHDGLKKSYLKNYRLNKLDRGMRASHQGAAKKLNLPKDVGPNTVVHEWSHALHQYNNETRDAVNAFWERRTSGGNLTTIYTDEEGYKDDFIDHYTGRVYGDEQFSDMWGKEVVSMGMEHMFEGAGDFYTKDRGHFDLIYSIMAGL